MIVPSCSAKEDVEGNSISSTPEVVKPLVINPSKKWCFTYNNYTVPLLTTLSNILNINCSIVFYSLEVGESGTPHAQGYFEFKKKNRPLTIFRNTLLEGLIHFEKAKGSLKENYEYCSKDNNFHYFKGVEQMRKMKLITPNRYYQEFILNIIKEEPDDRTIYWFYELEGNVGKTSFTKYLCQEHNALCLGGKAADVKHGVVSWLDKMGTTPSLIIYDIPRSFCNEFLNYEALESIKSMLFFSGKFEGKMVNGPPCHLIVFSNELPNIKKLSLDRWRIYKIKKDYKLKEKIPLEVIEIIE